MSVDEQKGPFMPITGFQEKSSVRAVPRHANRAPRSRLRWLGVAICEWVIRTVTVPTEVEPIVIVVPR